MKISQNTLYLICRRQNNAALRVSSHHSTNSNLNQRKRTASSFRLK